MSTAASPAPWGPPPFDGFRTVDCSAGICSFFCQQWCYIIFPPPPPSAADDNGPRTTLSPLIIALIAALASAFLLLAYYTIISKYYRRRRRGRGRSRRDRDGADLADDDQDQSNRDQPWQSQTRGLDEAIIRSIAVCKYKRGDGLVEGTDCSVCLSEFREEESLRLLPKCNHAFHVPCIDAWFKSHSNCPLCRSDVAHLSSNPNPIPNPNPNPNPNRNSSASAAAAAAAAGAPQNSPESRVSSSLQIQRGSDAIVIVEDLERGRREEIALSIFAAAKGAAAAIGGRPRRTKEEQEEDREGTIPQKEERLESIALAIVDPEEAGADENRRSSSSSSSPEVGSGSSARTGGDSESNREISSRGLDLGDEEASEKGKDSVASD